MRQGSWINMSLGDCNSLSINVLPGLRAECLCNKQVRAKESSIRAKEDLAPGTERHRRPFD